MPWRKLLCGPPAEWLRLPLITRGIGDELLRALDGRGEIRCDEEEPATVVCRILGAHPRERRLVRKCLEELVEGGWIAITDGTISGHLPDLGGARAERRRSVSGAPTERERSVSGARAEREPCTSGARVEHEDQPNPPELPNTDPVEKRREEERRGEGEETRGGARDPAPEDFTPASIVRGAYETALANARPVNGRRPAYVRRDGDAKHFREAADALVALSNEGEALRGAAERLAPLYVAEKYQRSPEWFAEWLAKRASAGAPVHGNRRNGFAAPADASAFEGAEPPDDAAYHRG